MSDAEGKLAGLLGLRKHLVELAAQKASQIPISCELDVKTTGKGTGTVTRNPEAERYDKGSVVSLTANAQAGSKFVRWMNDAIGSHPVCNLRMDKAKLVYAEFELAPSLLSLDVTITGMGRGMVMRVPDEESYKQGSLVSLTAVASEDSIFNGWKGDVVGEGPVCNLRMNSAKAITAEFGLAFKLKLTTMGFGSGSIARRPVLNHYPKGSSVTLIARPEAGSKFKQWQGDIAGSVIVATVTLDSDTTITAEFVKIEHALNIKTSGKGSGTILRSLTASSYEHDSSVTLTAIPDKGSQFKQWSGHVNGSNPVCTVKFDAEKEITAEFVRLFPLIANTSGNGSGSIVRSLDAHAYIEDGDIKLTAVPTNGSKFKRWHGDASGQDVTCIVTMDSAKTISAEFSLLEYFDLTVESTGTGSGIITRSPKAEKYVLDSTVSLTAKATVGSKFKCWHGDASGQDVTCTVTLDSAKTISAEFVQLESFTLDVTTTGTGGGDITRIVDAQTYFSGSRVLLTAQAEDGSVFNGWHGDATGMDILCSVTMNSDMSVRAEFEKVTISDTGITAELGPVERVEIKKGQLATVFKLTLLNNGEQQMRVKVPLTSYVSRSGQTSEQSSWATGLVNGSKGVTLSAGNFCEMGLVHFMQPAKGDRLYVNVEQVQPSARICFIFQCTRAGSWNTFQLINASLENQKATADAKEISPAMASALKRIESLESTLAEVLRRLDAMQSGFPRTASNDVVNQTVPVQTLAAVLAWVAGHDRVTVAELRARLLPLDLLPSAVIDEVNERALDLTGELVLEEVGDEVAVTRDILDEILANWGSPRLEHGVES